jgi:hypothetical protein
VGWRMREGKAAEILALLLLLVVPKMWLSRLLA